MINRKKRRRKTHPLLKLLLSILIITMLIVVALFLIGFNSQEKKEYELSLEKEVSEMTTELIEEIDELVQDQEIKPEDIVDSKDVTIVDSGSVSIRDSVEQSRKEQIKRSLTSSYEKILNQQKTMATSMINGLAAQAVSDYKALKASGNDTNTNLSKLASEYMAKASVMESQVDKSFDSILGRMESQLKSEGIDPDPIIDQYRAEYKRIKEANREKLMDKMLSQI